MKNISNALLLFLQANREFARYDLINLKLPNGQQIFATTCPTPVTFQGNLYHPSKFGIWERGAVTTEVAETPKSGSMSLTVSVENETGLPTLFYPGTTAPLFQAALVGLFDAAEVWVYSFWQSTETGWQPGVGLGPIPTTPETPQQAINNKGTMTMFGGVISKSNRASRSKFAFECRDMLYLLNLQFPVNVIQTSCPWTLYDARCALNINTFASATIAAATGSGQTLIICGTNPTVTVGPTTFSGLTGDYALGRIKFLTGQNAGFTFYIKANPSAAGVAQLVLSKPLPLPLTVGDTFLVYPGCNKTQARCNQFVDIVNYGGFPFVPNPEVAA